MTRARRAPSRWLRLSRWFMTGMMSCAPLASMACVSPPAASPPPTLASRDVSTATQPAKSGEGEKSSATGDIRLVNHVSTAGEKPNAGEPRVIPITLDAVLRLAEQHNPRVGLAREKLNESMLTSAQGSVGWLPNTYAGVAYYRHEGGIQDFQGNLLHSSTGAIFPGLQINSELDLREGVYQLVDLERRIWQNKAELSQINNEILLEAGLTYIDLLTARRGESLTGELQKFEEKLLERAEKLAKSERGAAGLVEAIKAALTHRQQTRAKLRQQGNAASAKLVYLLGLPPGTCLNPVDLIFAPFELVDVTPTVCDLVNQAWTHGPGIRELEGLLNIAQMALDKSYGPHNMLPVLQVNLMEGPFGAGPGGTVNWDNRFDLGLQVKWNLTQACQTEFKRNLIRSKQTQAMLNYEELRGKLALGVTESRDSILAGREQIGLAGSQIRHASENYRLSDRRMEEGLPGSTVGDVLMAIRNLEQAHFNHIQAIQGHNKGQIRMLMFLGGGPSQAIPVNRGESEASPAATLPDPRPLDAKNSKDKNRDPKDDKNESNDDPTSNDPDKTNVPSR
ncbi:MAG: TolC family protein [Gemmataceae bacterium]